MAVRGGAVLVMAVTVREPSGGGTQRLSLRATVPARSGPLGPNGVDGVGHQISGSFVVDPPAHKVRPGIGRVPFQREVDLLHALHPLEELLVRQGDAVLRIRLVGNFETHGLADPAEAVEPAAQAQPGGHVRRVLGRQRQEQGRGVQHGQQGGDPGGLGPRRAEPDQRQVGGVALGHVRGPSFPLGVQVRHRVDGGHTRAQPVVGAGQQLRPPGRHPGPGVQQRDLSLAPVERRVQGGQVGDLQGDDDQAGGGGQKHQHRRDRALGYVEAQGEQGRAGRDEGGGRPMGFERPQQQ